MTAIPNVGVIAQTIQLALAPVFVLVAIGNILNILSTRLGRIVDRSRELQARHPETGGPERDAVIEELRVIDQRIAFVSRAMDILVTSGLTVGVTVAILFVEEIGGWNLQLVAAATFLIAIALMMYALILFLRETRIASASLRIPRKFLK